MWWRQLHHQSRRNTHTGAHAHAVRAGRQLLRNVHWHRGRNLDGTIGNDRSMSIMVNSSSVGPITTTGTVETNGAIAFRVTAGGFVINWQGQFTASGGGVTGNGTWSSTSGTSGTWTGSRR